MIEKIYAVEFLEYTNCLKDTVSDYICKHQANLADINYIAVGKYPFLIKESDIEKYKQFGGGYKSLTFVGNLEI